MNGSQISVQNSPSGAYFDVAAIRKDFPILERTVHSGIPLVYLDSTATSQRPRQVIEAMDSFSFHSNANIHRGIHILAEEATAAYEEARVKIAKFINAPSARQMIFTRNTTESINLVSYSWGRANLFPGDVIVLTEMEHHSNLVPWQIIAKEIGLRLEFIPVTPDGLLDTDVYLELLNLQPKIVAFTHMSNVLGTITPAKEMISLAHQAGAITILDAAQSVPHLPVDVQDLDVDFMAFSAHKMLGPTGIGGLYGKKELLEAMKPFLGGGDMIKRVELRSFQPNSIPHKFEAGTPAITEAVGFGAAVDYLTKIGMDAIEQHEKEIVAYALERLEEIPGVKVFGPESAYKGGVVAFLVDDLHAHDISQVLDMSGIAVRAGHHCAQPLHDKFGITSTARASFYLYNSLEEVDILVDGIYKVKSMFR
jgi:cysteine desulfurase/selenocysteine lyase